MWAQDAAGDGRLRRLVGGRHQMTPFTPAPQITNAAGLAGQAAAVAKPLAIPAGSAQSVLDSSHHRVAKLTQNAGKPRHRAHDTLNGLLNSLFGATGGIVLLGAVQRRSKSHLALPPGSTTSGC